MRRKWNCLEIRLQYSGSFCLPNVYCKYIALGTHGQGRRRIKEFCAGLAKWQIHRAYCNNAHRSKVTCTFRPPPAVCVAGSTALTGDWPLCPKVLLKFSLPLMLLHVKTFHCNICSYSGNNSNVGKPAVLALVSLFLVGIEVACQWVCRERWARILLLCHDVFGNIKDADEEGEEKTDSPSRGFQKQRTETGDGSEEFDGTGCTGQLQCSPKASGWF